MAKTFLVPIDLNGNEIQNVLAQQLASDPGSPVEGQFWYNSTSHELKYYDGTSVIVVGSASDEMVQDIVGAMVSGNTETGISVVYQDSDGTLDFAVSGDHTLITDFDTQVRTSRLDQMAAPGADVSMNSHKLTSVTDPTSAQDAATKNYVDGLLQGVKWKAPVRAASTANGTLATAFENGDALDGVTLATGDRILLKNQTSGAENGIYVVAASGAPTRATDTDVSAEISGMAVFVEEGTTNADSGWVCTNDGAITLGTTALTFVQFTALGQITAGNGFTKTGATLDVGAGTGILANANDVAVDTSVVVRKFAASVGDGAALTYNVDHNLGTTDVTVGVYRNSDGVEVECDVTHSTTNRVIVGFSVAPTSNQYRVVVHG